MHDRAGLWPDRSIAAASWGPVRRSGRRVGCRDRAARPPPRRTQIQDDAIGCIAQAHLGRTGVEVSMLNLGTWRSVGLDRILRFAWANGIRYIDTAKSYGSEPAIGRWLQAMPEVRKELFLVTKDHPRSPQAADQATGRTARRHFKTDYVDLIFIHARGRPRLRDRGGMAQEQGVQGDRRGDPQVGQGAVRRVFHPPPRPSRRSSRRRPTAASSTSIMLQNNPWIAEEIGQKDEINRALDTCHKAGIGLISMKQVAGNMNLDEIGQAAAGPQGKGPEALPGPAARDLDRRAVFLVLRVDAQHRPGPRERRGGPGLQAADQGRDRSDARRLSSPPVRLCAPAATAGAAWPPARRPSWAT